MDWLLTLDGKQILYIMAVLVGSGLVLSFLLLLWVIWQVRRIELPINADFMTALRATPFVVVLLLDLLDFSLDLFGAPVAWIVLTRLGLGPLRGVTIVEQLIPGTQLLPTMTIAWLIARLVRDKDFFEKLPGKK